MPDLRSSGSSQPIRAILIYQTKFLGDLVLSSLLADNLRLEYPDVRIVFVADRGYRRFLIDHGIAEDVIELGRKRMRGRSRERAAEFAAALRQMRNARFDMTIDLTDSKTSRFITRLVNAPIRVGYSTPERPFRWWERQPANVTSQRPSDLRPALRSKMALQSLWNGIANFIRSERRKPGAATGISLITPISLITDMCRRRGRMTLKRVKCNL